MVKDLKATAKMVKKGTVKFQTPDDISKLFVYEAPPPSEASPPPTNSVASNQNPNQDHASSDVSPAQARNLAQALNNEDGLNDGQPSSQNQDEDRASQAQEQILGDDMNNEEGGSNSQAANQNQVEDHEEEKSNGDEDDTSRK